MLLLNKELVFDDLCKFLSNSKMISPQSFINPNKNAIPRKVNTTLLKFLPSSFSSAFSQSKLLVGRGI